MSTLVGADVARLLKRAEVASEDLRDLLRRARAFTNLVGRSHGRLEEPAGFRQDFATAVLDDAFSAAIHCQDHLAGLAPRGAAQYAHIATTVLRRHLARQPAAVAELVALARTPTSVPALQLLTGGEQQWASCCRTGHTTRSARR